METHPSKNQFANLIINIFDSGLEATLLYQNRAINRQYVLHDVFDIDLYDSYIIENLTNILIDFFSQLTVKWNWIFFEKITANGTDVYSLMRFTNEGLGVSKITVVIDKKNPLFQNIIESVRLISPEIKIRFRSNIPEYKNLEKFLLKFGYTDFLRLNIDLHSISYQRLAFKDIKENLANIHLPKFDIYSATRSLNEVNNLFDLVEQREFRVFTTIVSNKNDLIHKWINFLSNFNQGDSSYIVQDLVRSYVLASLISMFNENRDHFKDIFVDKKSLLWIEGSLVNLINPTLLYSTIVDAFQLKGDFDILSAGIYQISSVFEDNLNMDSNTKIFDFDNSDISCVRYSTAENMNEFKTHKVFLRSTLHRENGMREILYAMSDKVNVLPINDYAGLMEFRNSNNDLVYTVDFKSEAFPIKNYIIDARFRPITYGKTPNDNRNNFSKWFDDFNV